MSKALNFIIIVTVLVLGLGYIGIVDTTTSQILSKLSAGESSGSGGWNNSELYNAIILVFGLAAAAGIIRVGFFQTQNTTDFLIATVSSLIAGMVIADLMSVYTNISEVIPGELSWLLKIVHFMIVIILVGFIVSMISWWRGSDG